MGQSVDMGTIHAGDFMVRFLEIMHSSYNVVGPLGSFSYYLGSS